MPGWRKRIAFVYSLSRVREIPLCASLLPAAAEKYTEARGGGRGVGNGAREREAAFSIGFAFALDARPFRPLFRDRRQLSADLLKIYLR